MLNETANLYETKSENLNTFNVYFYLSNEKSENTFLVKSDKLNIDTECVSDLIFNIIKKINSQKIEVNDKNNEYILSLKEYENIDFYNDNYELRPFMKIFHIPKFDCPCFSPKLLLNELITQEICLVVKKLSNIKLSEKYDDDLNC